MRGIIIATERAQNQGKGLASLIRIAGSPLLARHLRMMKSQGIEDVLIVALAEDHQSIRKRLKHKPRGLNIILSPPGEDGTLGSILRNEKYSGGIWLIADGGLLFDSRLPGLLAGKKEEKICLLPVDDVPEQDLYPALVCSSKMQEYVFAGCAWLSTGKLSCLDFSSTKSWMKGFQDVLNENEEIGFDLSQQTKYRPGLRRKSDFLWLPVRSPQSNKRAKKLLIAAAQKKILDWPAWFIHRPIENWIVYHICDWPLTPNQITLITNVIALAVIVLFATGEIGVGLILALIVGILDGLDGKQARVKHIFTEFGKLEHIFDKVYEILWYTALAYLLFGQGFGYMPWILLAVLAAGTLLDVVIVNAYQSQTGIPFDDSGPFERSFRWFAGRRNIYFWVLVPFVAGEAFGASGALFEGYRIIALYALLTLLVRMWRLMLRRAEKDGLEEGEIDSIMEEEGIPAPVPEMAVLVVPRGRESWLTFHKVCDVPLLLRTLLSLKKEGVKTVYVVVPEDEFLVEKIKDCLDDPRISDVRIELRGFWDLLPTESFWLLPATLVWTRSLFRQCLKSHVRHMSQKEPSQNFCYLENKSRGLVPLFWIKKGETEIQNIIRALQDRGTVSRGFLVEHGGIPILMNEDEDAVQVQSESDIVPAERMLLRDNIKETDGIISSSINRRISRLMTARLISTRANQYFVTGVVFLIGLLAVYITQKGDYLSTLIGAVLLNLNSITDGVDGELARLRFNDSVLGEWVDRISDKVVYVLFYVAILIGYWRTHPGSFVNIIGILSVGSFAVGSVLLYIYGFTFKKTTERLYIPRGSRFLETAHRIIFGAVFGSVELGEQKKTSLPRTKSSMQGWNYLIKNDIQCVYFVILSFFGVLYLIPILLLPYGMFLLFMGFYSAALLIFRSKSLLGEKNKN